MIRFQPPAAKIIIGLLLMAVFVLAASGCLQKDKAKPDEPEMIMGRDCGLDFFPCCNEEPACSFSQMCCADPNGGSRNYCADSCDCGGEKQFCCADNQCHDGLVCLDGFCAVCGELDQACCAGDKCRGDLLCGQGTCLECGPTGNPCCPGGKCFDQIKQDESRADCFGGQCQLCGYGGNQACLAAPICVVGNLENNGVCYLCGGPNQPCCNELSGVSYQCDPKQGLVCELGFCSPQ